MRRRTFFMAFLEVELYLMSLLQFFYGNRNICLFKWDPNSKKLENESQNQTKTHLYILSLIVLSSTIWFLSQFTDALPYRLSQQLQAW